MEKLRGIADIRRDYGELNLSEESLPENPITLFKLWLEDALNSENNDPTAMVLSTVDDKGYPDSRVVLLKDLDKDCFIFYTNYQSTKAVQIKNNPFAALNFYWSPMSRQVRIRGHVKKITEEKSDHYFSSRPIKSQFTAIISPQSHQIQDRASLEKALNELIKKNERVARPSYWGGYMLIPDEVEFWQGRDNRLHDRIHYYKQNTKWKYHRLAP